MKRLLARNLTGRTVQMHLPGRGYVRLGPRGEQALARTDCLAPVVRKLVSRGILALHSEGPTGGGERRPAPAGKGPVRKRASAAKAGKRRAPVGKTATRASGREAAASPAPGHPASDTEGTAPQDRTPPHPPSPGGAPSAGAGPEAEPAPGTGARRAPAQSPEEPSSPSGPSGASPEERSEEG